MSETTFVWVEQEKGPLPPVGGVCSTRFVCSWGGHEARVVYLPGDPGHNPCYYFEIDGKRRGWGWARTAEEAKRLAEQSLVDAVAKESWRLARVGPTPGPWAVDGPANNNLVVGAPGLRGQKLRQVVAEVPLVVGYLADPTPEAEANARLVAAAPALLEALKRLLHETEEGQGLCSREVARAARDAVNLAEGG
jgi:hypothetical protein